MLSGLSIPDRAKAVARHTVWLGDIPIATRRPNGSSVAIYYVVTDQLNTPREVIRPERQHRTVDLVHSAFRCRDSQHEPQGAGTFTYDLRFPGRIAGAWGGTFQNDHRDYDPTVGKYDESDPLGLKAGVNTYAYMGSAPLMSSDPSGLLARGRGWSNQQWNDVEKAEARIRKAVERCSCPEGGSCVPCNLAQTLLNRLDTMIVAYAPLGGDCGWTPPSNPPQGLFLSPNAWNPKECVPGCLASTLYHELLHTTGLVFDVPNGSEPPAADLEKACIGDLCTKSSP